MLNGLVLEMKIRQLHFYAVQTPNTKCKLFVMKLVSAVPYHGNMEVSKSANQRRSPTFSSDTTCCRKDLVRPWGK